MVKHTGIKYNGIDIGKFICALVILFYHYFSEHGSLPAILDEALSLYAVAVALFIVLSGFLLFNKLEKVTGVQNRWRLVKKQVCRILMIYFYWSIPYLIFTISNWNWGEITPSFVFWQVQGWVFSSTFSTIWFMPALAIGIVVTFWLTEKFPKSVFLIAIISYLLGSLTLTYNFLGNCIPHFNQFLAFANVWLGGARGGFFYAFPLILLGRWMVCIKERVHVIPMVVLSLVSGVFLLVEALYIRKLSGVHTGIDLTIMMIPTVVCISGFLISPNFQNNKVYLWMRNMSTLIFLSQRLFLTVFPHIFSGIFISIYKNMWLGFVITVTLTILFSMVIIYLSKRYLFFKKLF